MCSPASMVIADGGKKCLWSKNSDSHEAIIKEFGLSEGNGRINFVRIEISPENGRLDSPTEEWKYKTDQKDVPDWYDAVAAEALARLELKAWCEQKIITTNRRLEGGQFYVFGNSVVSAHDNSVVSAYDNSQVTAHDNSVVTAHDNSQVTAYANATTIIAYRHVDKSVLKSADAVLVDRTVSPPVCTVGVQE